MKLLLLPLLAALALPMSANASDKDFNVRDTCSRLRVDAIYPKEALKRLNLPLKKKDGEKITQNFYYEYAYNYCNYYYQNNFPPQ